MSNDMKPKTEEKKSKTPATDLLRSMSRAREAFDTITGASYYGFAMREFLATNEEALQAAEKLAAFLQAAGLKGST